MTLSAGGRSVTSSALKMVKAHQEWVQVEKPIFETLIYNINSHVKSNHPHETAMRAEDG